MDLKEEDMLTTHNNFGFPIQWIKRESYEDLDLIEKEFENRIEKLVDIIQWMSQGKLEEMERLYDKELEEEVLKSLNCSR